MEIFSFDTLLDKDKFEEFKKEFLLRDIFLPKLELDIGADDYEWALKEFESRFKESDYSINNDNITVIQYEVKTKGHEPSIELFSQKDRLILKMETDDQILEIRTKDKMVGSVISEEIEYYTEVEKSLNFYTDELFPKMDSLPNTYIGIIEKNLNHLKVESDIRSFCNLKLKKLDDWRKDIKSANYLIEDVKIKSNDAIDKIQKFIKSDILQKGYSSINKIQIYLTKKQLISLFHLLVKNEYILLGEKEEPSFYRKLEQTFQFFGDSGEFEDLGDARKYHLKCFGPKAERYPFDAIDDLEKIFMDKNFYRNTK